MAATKEPRKLEKRINPINKWLLVRKEAAPEKSKAGIIIPGGQHERIMNEGEVLAISPDLPKENGAPMVKPGDVVIWGVYTGQAAGHSLDTDQRLWFVKFEDVLAVKELA